MLDSTNEVVLSIMTHGSREVSSMRISVVGSWQDKETGWQLFDGDKFDDACASLGREIALKGHTLMIGSEISILLTSEHVQALSRHSERPKRGIPR
jgi:hypothetical protein